MKRIYLHTFAAVTAAVTLTGCAKEDIEPDAVRACPTFSALIDGVHSRATEDYWEREDKIGISGGTAINVCHITKTGESVFTVEAPEQQIYYLDANRVEFTAYYPYNSSLNATTGLISISTADQTIQKEFDFLWAAGTGSKSKPTVEFNFTHRMSKVTFIFKNGNNMDVSSITRCRLSGLVVEGTFDSATGICSVNQDTPAAATNMPLTNVKSEEPVAPLFIFPQTVAAPLKLEIYDNNNQYYVGTLSVPDNEFEAGTNYTYTITVSKTGLIVTGATLSDWIEQEGASEASSADD